jgi:hypothetical protein
MLDLAGDSMCLAKAWQVWGDIMILPTDVSQLDAYPTDWTRVLRR